MKYLLTPIIFILFFSAVSGQRWTVLSEHTHFVRELGKEAVTVRDSYDGIEGSPFLNDDFVEGSLITRDSLMYQNVPLRYNIFKDEMEFLVESGSSPMIIGTPQNFLFFRINDKTFSYLAYNDGNTPKRGYFEVMNQGECQILRRRHITYRDPEPERGYSPAQPASFVTRKDLFYVKTGGQTAEEIKLRRRDILSVFDEKKDEVSGFVSENNLSYRSADDLVKIAEFYNQIMNK